MQYLCGKPEDLGVPGPTWERHGKVAYACHLSAGDWRPECLRDLLPATLAKTVSFKFGERHYLSNKVLGSGDTRL